MLFSTGKQIITIYILHNISRSKNDQTRKIGKLLDYNVRILSFKNHAENDVGEVVAGLFFKKKKALNEVKANDHHHSFNILQYCFTWTYSKRERNKMSDC